MYWILVIAAVLGTLYALNRRNSANCSFDYLGRRVSLLQLREQYSGAKYGGLVMQHVNNHSLDSFRQEAVDLVPMVPPELRKIGESMVDDYVGKCVHESLLDEDCANVLWRICEDFKSRVASAGHQGSDKAAFVIFQMVTTSAALTFKQYRPVDKAAVNRELEELFDLDPGTLSQGE